MNKYDIIAELAHNASRLCGQNDQLERDVKSQASRIHNGKEENNRQYDELRAKEKKIKDQAEEIIGLEHILYEIEKKCDETGIPGIRELGAHQEKVERLIVDIQTKQSTISRWIKRSNRFEKKASKHNAEKLKLLSLLKELRDKDDNTLYPDDVTNAFKKWQKAQASK